MTIKKTILTMCVLFVAMALGLTMIDGSIVFLVLYTVAVLLLGRQIHILQLLLEDRDISAAAAAAVSVQTETNQASRPVPPA